MSLGWLGMRVSRRSWRRLAGTTVVGLLALCGSARATLSGPASGASVGERQLSGEVVYGYRQCTSAPASRQAPLAGAELLVRAADGRVITTRLDGRGRFDVLLPPALPVKAWAVLSDSELSVSPDAAGAGPYHIPLGAVAFQQGRRLVLRRRFVITGPGFEGAANIWTVLHKGTTVASAASPVRLPAVTARWSYGRDLSAGGTHYDPSNHTIYVGSEGGTRDEWEPWPLLHEYGHHMLYIVADPQASGGDHSLVSVHPTEPALPWSEGFAHAFAAIVLKEPLLTLSCQEKADFSSVPVHPPPSDTKLAQYNEAAIGAVLWRLTGHLGGGNLVSGLRVILRALHAHPAHSMRDFRDALISDGHIETTADEHQTIDEIFGDQRIAWGIAIVGIGPNFNADVYGPGLADELTVNISGAAPYDSCHLASDVGPAYGSPGYAQGDLPGWLYGGGGFVGFAGRGGLSYAWQSDCITDADGVASYWGGTGSYDYGSDQTLLFYIPFPYAGDGRPSGDHKYTVSVGYTCATSGNGESCPTSIPVDVQMNNGAQFRDGGPIPASALNVTDLNVTLQLNAYVPVLEFDGIGHCHSLVDSEDCGD